MKPLSAPTSISHIAWLRTIQSICAAAAEFLVASQVVPVIPLKVGASPWPKWQPQPEGRSARTRM
jgi:hypothetical protein